jgi:hypothetical protein
MAIKNREMYARYQESNPAIQQHVDGAFKMISEYFEEACALKIPGDDRAENFVAEIFRFYWKCADYTIDCDDREIMKSREKTKTRSGAN